MSGMMKFEFRKLVRSKSLYICSAVIVVLLMISVLTYKMLEVISEQSEQIGDMMSSVMGSVLYNGRMMMISALSGSDIAIVLAVFITLFVCGDFSSGVLRNVMTKGYSNTDNFFAKYFAVITATVFMSLIAMLAGFLGGTLFWGAGSGWRPKDFALLLTQLFIVIAYATLMFMVAMLLKKTGLVMAVCILAPLVLMILLTLINVIVKSQVINISDYWLDNCLANVSNADVKIKVIIRSIITAAAYLASSLTVGVLFNKKTEV